MASVQVMQRMTADEYLALELEERCVELVDGQIVIAQPALPHQDAVLEIAAALREWTRAADGRGRATLAIDVLMDEHNVYAPDVLWYRDGRVPHADAARPYPLADLAVEVRSPSTWRYDVGTKKSVYERKGLPELWLVDVEGACVLVFRRSAPGIATFDVALELDTAATLTSPLLPGFAAPVGPLLSR